jgi:hypothetical protein
MQVVIPIVPQIDNTELRYCLRSLEKFLDAFEVTIVGSVIPDWITGVEWIELPDLPGRKQLSIKRKIMAALHRYDEIFYTADDCYLLKQTVAKKFPYICNGELAKRNHEGGAAPLVVQLQEMGKTTLNFDCHYPLVYRKDFLEIIPLFKDNTLVKSAYCNYLSVPVQQKKDAKIISPMQSHEVEKFCSTIPAFSTGHNTVRSCKPFLEKLFPEQSRFEVYE